MNHRLNPTRLRRSLSFLCLALIVSSFSNAQVINEYLANHTGTDTHEYLEFLGTPDTAYPDLWMVQIEGDTEDGPGTLDSVYQIGTTNGEGLWVTSFLNNELHNGTTTFLLVENFNGTIGTDLDTNDDGSLDTTPWTRVLDSVAVFDDDNAADQTYLEGEGPALAPFFDGMQFEPGGASRIPNGVDTNAASDWVRNDWHGEGLPGFSGSLVVGEAANTPGAVNTAPRPREPVINEIVADHVGNDTHEFIEIFAGSETNYSSFTLLILEGDGGENPGFVDAGFTPGTTSNVGFWQTGPLSDQIENGSLTVLMVDGFSGAIGDDLDTNDDGVLDSSPWTTLYDAVSISHGGANDRFYAPVILDARMDGGSTAPGGVSRYPHGADTDTVADWRRNDFDGAGLDGFSGTVDREEAFNTPDLVVRVNATDYYEDVDASTSTTLRTTLHNVIQDHVPYPYSDSDTDSWDILANAHQDPNSAGELIDIYRNESYTIISGGTGPYNREHTWPNSYGFPSNSSIPYTDCHHLYPSNTNYNSSRGNKPFGFCVSGCAELVTVDNNGVGGGSGTYPGNSNWHASLFEVWMHRRGDIARAQFYMDLRYEGGTHAITGATEPQLVLTDEIGLIQTTSSGTAYMGLLADLLEWHRQDPVDEEELARNEAIYLYQGNRNPFVDHPEWVGVLYSDFQLPTCFTEQVGSWRAAVGPCTGETYSVRDLIQLVNGTCTCP